VSYIWLDTTIPHALIEDRKKIYHNMNFFFKAVSIISTYCEFFPSSLQRNKCKVLRQHHYNQSPLCCTNSTCALLRERKRRGIASARGFAICQK
jgi:hypothetical protein